MSEHLEREISRLKQHILKLGAKVEENLNRALKSLQNYDADLAQQAVDADREIDLLEVDIEEECLKVMALHQPVANDLRFIVTVLKINNDLERVGDHGVNIAENTLYITGHATPPPVPNFAELARKAAEQLRDSLNALVNKDPKEALRIWKDDDVVDDLTEQVCRDLEDQMPLDQDLMPCYLRLLTTAKTLERVGDHATNIAKDVLYMVTGEIVRHKGKLYKT